MCNWYEFVWCEPFLVFAKFVASFFVSPNICMVLHVHVFWKVFFLDAIIFCIYYIAAITSKLVINMNDMFTLFLYKEMLRLLGRCSVACALRVAHMCMWHEQVVLAWALYGSLHVISFVTCFHNVKLCGLAARNRRRPQRTLGTKAIIVPFQEESQQRNP